MASVERDLFPGKARVTLIQKAFKEGERDVANDIVRVQVFDGFGLPKRDEEMTRSAAINADYLYSFEMLDDDES